MSNTLEELGFKLNLENSAGVILATLLQRKATESVFVDLLRSPGIDSQSRGIEALESIPGLLKRFQILALVIRNRFRGTDDWGYQKFKNSGSVHPVTFVATVN